MYTSAALFLFMTIAVFSKELSVSFGSFRMFKTIVFIAYFMHYLCFAG